MSVIPATQRWKYEDHILRPAQAKVSETLSQKQTGCEANVYNPSYTGGREEGHGPRLA
jgi:hypothetical protein